MTKENEIGLLGAVMRNPERFEELAEIVTENDFTWHCYGWVWKAFRSLHERGLGIDTITTGDELQRAGRLADFALDGGMFRGRAALAHIRAEGDPRNASAYAANVLDQSAKKQLSELMGLGASWSANGRQAHDIMSDLSQRMAEIRTFDNKSARHTQKLADAVSEAYDLTDAAARGEIQFVMTGYPDLDDLLSGLSAPDLYVIAARPGMGKTAWLASVARNAAKKKHTVAVFSLEMKNSQIAMRLLAQESGVSFDRQKSGKLQDTDWPRYTQAVETLSDFEQYPLYLNDLPSIKPSQIRRELRRMANVELVIVDYIQLADADGKYERRDLEVSAVTKGLKAIAKEFNVPVLAAAQLSRAVEQRAEKIPILSDLKESGGIEENADCVMFIYRPDQYDKDAERNTAEIIIAKHRNGRVGKVDMVYLPHLTRFESKAHTYRKE